MVLLSFNGVGEFMCALSSAGDPMTAVYRVDLTAEDLELDHDNLQAMWMYHFFQV